MRRENQEIHPQMTQRGTQINSEAFLFHLRSSLCHLWMNLLIFPYPRSSFVRKSAPMTIFRISLVLLLGFVSAPARADGPFALKGGERIVVIGDSITQAGGYVVDFEAFLLTRFPDKAFTVLNHGLSSETASGTSEPDHTPHRPCIHDRFDRDVTEWKPDVVVACYGMNDGNYVPYLDAARFDRYQAGINRLLTRIRDNAHARPILMTPPPFDANRRVDNDPGAEFFGYKHPSADYDRTLGHYAEWLLTLREDALIVADVHAASNELLRARRIDLPGFFLAGDAVHPGPTGHWLIAQTLLLALNAPSTVSDARVAADSLKVESGSIRDLRRDGHSLRFSWTSLLPIPLEPTCDARSLAIEHVSDRLNRHRLAIDGLKPGKYRLMAQMRDEPEIPAFSAEFTADQLASGLDLTTLPEFPTTRLSGSLRPMIVSHRRAIDQEWRGHRDRIRLEVDPSLDALRKRCREREMIITLEPVS